MHTVRFKCIGSNREGRYQQALAEAAKLINEETEVEVNIFPEPTNRYDAQAIVFKCKLYGQWKPVGYVVREALGDVGQNPGSVGTRPLTLQKKETGLL